MNKRIRFISFVLLLNGLFCTSVAGQTHDWQSRLGYSVITDLNDKFSAGISLEQRFGYDCMHYDRSLIEPELKYRMSDRFDFSMTYRAWAEKENAGYFFRHRLSPAFSIVQPIGDWRLKYTCTAQYRFSDYDESGGLQQFVLRNKLSLRYSIFGSRFRPELRAELFSGQQSYGTWQNYQVRYTALTSFRLSRLSSLEFYLLYDQEFNVARPDQTFAMGLSFIHQLMIK
jgi:hypothetical protein